MRSPIPPRPRKSRLALLALALAASAAAADPVPYSALSQEGGPSAYPPAAPSPGSPSETLRAALEAAEQGQVGRAEALKAGLSDPVAAKIVDWALVDADGSMLDLQTVRAASATLAGWPRSAHRRSALEKALDAASPSPAEVIAAFSAGADAPPSPAALIGQVPEAPVLRSPLTAQGAMALASALEAQNRPAEAQSLIRKFWRTKVFEADLQAQMRARFGRYLTPEDDRARLDALLYGPQGPAMRAMIDIAPPDVKSLAEARIAFRADRSDAPALYDLVPGALKDDPGLAFDRARYLRKRDLDVIALSLAPSFPTSLPSNPDIQSQVWTERRALMNSALKAGDPAAAYALAAKAGLTQPSEAAEAAFFAGWIALDKLKDPALADQRFAEMEAMVTSPISVARALYWRGRAAAARGNQAQAAEFFGRAARHSTTFYGQLAAEKLGRRELVLGRDPEPTPAERAAFSELELVRAIRLLHEAGERDLVRVFALDAAETLPKEADLVQLIDLLRGWGEPDLAMRAVRLAAQRGYILPERGYPLLSVSPEPGAAETAFMLSIARQESNFDPYARSGPGARGLMQLMPATAQTMARRLGVSYSTDLLQDGSYNLRLGGQYLGHLVDLFGGSYVLASAGYNAGPGRPPQWIAYCGDPRGGGSDPVDFIECIPFSETRNYVMRTLETTEVYRARLNGGVAPLTLAEDLKRGAWTPPPAFGATDAGLPPSVPTPPPVGLMTSSRR